MESITIIIKACTHTGVSTTTVSPSDRCSLPADIGPCDGIETKWFFNSVTKMCKEFTYGGCDGNDNRFNDKASCEMACKRYHCPATQVGLIGFLRMPFLGLKEKL